MMKENKIMHYSSSNMILLVGEGDFSFSVCLARAFGTSANMVATSLYSVESLLHKYRKASTNLNELKELGCTTMHDVNAHTMGQHAFLQGKHFDRIIFNFPHAGFTRPEHDLIQIVRHRNVVRGFLNSARDMLSENGEIHVTHKVNYPYSKWEIEKLANDAGLSLVEKAPFFIWDYPGYVNKKGQGPKCDLSFAVCNSVTFKFALDCCVSFVGHKCGQISPPGPADGEIGKKLKIALDFLSTVGLKVMYDDDDDQYSTDSKR